jgi:CubicO group peptidase (beta-lactamase class C family)
VAAPVSRAPDYLRFTRILFRRAELDGVSLLEAETVELMTRNHLPPSIVRLDFGEFVAEGEGYGLSVGVIVKPGPTAMTGTEGTFWWSGAWNTHFWIDPVRQLSGIFMTQSEPFDFASVGVQFRSLVYEALAD